MVIRIFRKKMIFPMEYMMKQIYSANLRYHIYSICSIYSTLYLVTCLVLPPSQSLGFHWKTRHLFTQKSFVTVYAVLYMIRYIQTVYLLHMLDSWSFFWLSYRIRKFFAFFPALFFFDILKQVNFLLIASKSSRRNYHNNHISTVRICSSKQTGGLGAGDKPLGATRGNPHPKIFISAKRW